MARLYELESLSSEEWARYQEIANPRACDGNKQTKAGYRRAYYAKTREAHTAYQRAYRRKKREAKAEQNSLDNNGRNK